MEHARLTYACQRCEGQVATAAKPPQAIDKRLPGPGLLAQVVVSKYHDHLPLHRQERIFERQGFLLNRATTCEWMAACAALLKPLYALMAERVAASKVLHVDDTPVPVRDETRTTTRRGHLWTYLGDPHHPYNVFDFRPNHSRDGPVNFLKNFRGYLQADAYSGYESLYKGGTIHEAACWAHTRRSFYEAKNSDAARSHQALAFIRQLYAVEEQARAAGCRRVPPCARSKPGPSWARSGRGSTRSWSRAPTRCYPRARWARPSGMPAATRKHCAVTRRTAT